MVDQKYYSLLKVAETNSITKAAAALSLTQPAVSQHILQLEKELDVQIFERSNSGLRITREGEIVLRYAKCMLSLEENLRNDILDCRQNITTLRVGITHTAESNAIAETFARYAQIHDGIKITLITDANANLYEMLHNYALDLAIVEGRISDPSLRYMLLDTDCIVLAVAPDHPLAKRDTVSIEELKHEKMILRLPDSNTCNQFIASLESRNMSISDFNVILEIDNIATIKDLIRHGIGVSVLAKSACLEELHKHKISVLTIESLSMMREINIVYSCDFEHMDVLHDIINSYNAERFYPVSQQ